MSAGIFGYPLAEATSVIAHTVVSWIEQHPDALDEIRLVGFNGDAAEAFAEAVQST